MARDDAFSRIERGRHRLRSRSRARAHRHCATLRWHRCAKCGNAGRARSRFNRAGLESRKEGERHMFDLTGKGALVTGASGGIGGAITKALHGQGATVAISGTNKEKLESVAGELGSRVFVLPCDLRDRQAVAKLADEAEKTLGQTDILVNNAGITHDNLFMRMKDEEWDDVILVNLTSVFVLTRGILRGMMRRRYGRIVNIASISGVLGNPGQPNYAASKAGLVGMTKSLAREVASRGITANAIARSEEHTSELQSRVDIS